MCEKKINTWLSSLLRESGFRKSIILYGNVGDICYNSDSGKYELIINLIENKLRGTGFEEVVRWDLVDGIRTQLNNYDYIDELYKQSIEEDVINNENLNDTGGSNYFSDNEMDCIQKEQSSYNIDLENFFNIVYKSMVKRTSKKTAFIVDWSNYIFGNANSLSEKERKYLTVIGKAIRNAPTDLDYKSIDRPANILILITNNIGAIPPAYYQNNPAVKTINIPIPGRLEREKYLMDNIDKFKLDRLLRPKDREFVDFVDLLDGFTIRDINQMIKLSRQIENPLSPEKLVNLYKYGEQNSPWENLSKEKIRDIDEVLKKRVKGQDEAINKVKKVIIRAFTGFSGIQHSSKLKKPKGILFFVGPTGVGKTELAKALAEFLFGDENACIRFDMSEFNHEHSDQRLIGAPPGYVGYEEGGQLTNAIKERPFSVLLFDEIEKAHGRILDKFLQILEDGRLTDGRGETVYFSEAVIIFTSNIGATEVDMNMTNSEIREDFLNKVKNHFLNELKRPELLNRIGDNIVVFNYIKDINIMMDIVKIKIKPLEKYIKEKYGMSIYFEDEERAIKAILSLVDTRNGGRGIINVMEPIIIDPLSEFIFENEEYFSPGKKIKIIQFKDDPIFDFELE